MGREVRRLRGLLVRMALRRWPAIACGAALATPAVVLLAGDFSWESWYTDGLALVLGATGAAFLIAGLGGRRADWIE